MTKLFLCAIHWLLCSSYLLIWLFSFLFPPLFCRLLPACPLYVWCLTIRAVMTYIINIDNSVWNKRSCQPLPALVATSSLHLFCPVQFSHLEPVCSGAVKVAGESYKAERWLLHSLQVHMLSAQLRPLLRHLEHTRKYYNGDSHTRASGACSLESLLISRYLISFILLCVLIPCRWCFSAEWASCDCHVPVSGSCGAKQPKTAGPSWHCWSRSRKIPWCAIHICLFQLDRSLFTRQLSPLKSPPVLGLLKSQSLCVLPGAGGAWRNADSTARGECLNRRLTTSNCSLREAVCTGHDSQDSTGAGSHNTIGTSEEGIAVGDFFFFFPESNFVVIVQGQRSFCRELSCGKCGSTVQDFTLSKCS